MLYMSNWRLYRTRKTRQRKARNGREKKRTGSALAREHRTRPELAVEMLLRPPAVCACHRPDSSRGGQRLRRQVGHVISDRKGVRYQPIADEGCVVRPARRMCVATHRLAPRER